jgi:hypothetical protein
MKSFYLIVVSFLFFNPAAFASFDRQEAYELANTFRYIDKNDVKCKSNGDDLSRLMLIDSLSGNAKASIGLNADTQLLLTQLLRKPTNNAKYTDKFYVKKEDRDGNQGRLTIINGCNLSKIATQYFELNEPIKELVHDVLKEVESTLSFSGFSGFLANHRKEYPNESKLESAINVTYKIASHVSSVHSELDGQDAINKFLDNIPKTTQFLNHQFTNQWHVLNNESPSYAFHGAFPSISMQHTIVDGSKIKTNLRLVLGTNLDLDVKKVGGHKTTRKTGVSVYTHLDVSCGSDINRAVKETFNCLNDNASDEEKAFFLKNESLLVRAPVLESDTLSFLKNYPLSHFNLKKTTDNISITPSFMLYINNDEALIGQLEVNENKIGINKLVKNFKEQLKNKFERKELLKVGNSNEYEIISYIPLPGLKFSFSAKARNRNDNYIYDLTLTTDNGHLKLAVPPQKSPSHLFISDLSDNEIQWAGKSSAEIRISEIEYWLRKKSINESLAKYLYPSRYAPENCFKEELTLKHPNNETCGFVKLDEFKWVDIEHINATKPPVKSGLKGYLRWMEFLLVLRQKESIAYDRLQRVVFDFYSDYTLVDKNDYNAEHILTMEKNFFTGGLEEAVKDYLKESKSEKGSEKRSALSKLSDVDKFVNATYKKYCEKFKDTSKNNFHSCSLAIGIKGGFENATNWWFASNEEIIEKLPKDFAEFTTPSCSKREGIPYSVGNIQLLLYSRNIDKHSCADDVPLETDVFIKEPDKEPIYLTSIPFYFFKGADGVDKNLQFELVHRLLSSKLSIFNNKKRVKKDLIDTIGLHIKALKSESDFEVSYPEDSDFKNILQNLNSYFLQALQINVNGDIKSDEIGSYFVFELKRKDGKPNKYRFYSASKILFHSENSSANNVSTNKQETYTNSEDSQLYKATVYSSTYAFKMPEVLTFRNPIVDAIDDISQNSKEKLNELLKNFELEGGNVSSQFNLPKIFNVKVDELNEDKIKLAITINKDKTYIECDVSSGDSVPAIFSKMFSCKGVDTESNGIDFKQYVIDVMRYKFADKYLLSGLRIKRVAIESELKKLNADHVNLNSSCKNIAVPNEELERVCASYNYFTKSRKQNEDAVSAIVKDFNDNSKNNNQVKSLQIIDILNLYNQYYIKAALSINDAKCDIDPKLVTALNEVVYMDEENPKLILPILKCKNVEQDEFFTAKLYLSSVDLFTSPFTPISEETLIKANLYSSDVSTDINNSIYNSFKANYYSYLEGVVKSKYHPIEWELYKPFLNKRGVKLRTIVEGKDKDKIEFSYVEGEVDKSPVPLFFYDRKKLKKYFDDKQNEAMGDANNYFLELKSAINFSIEYWIKKKESYLLKELNQLESVYGMQQQPPIDRLIGIYSAYLKLNPQQESFEEYLYNQVKKELLTTLISTANEKFKNLFKEGEFKEDVVKWSAGDLKFPSSTITIPSCPKFIFKESKKTNEQLSFITKATENQFININIKDFLDTPTKIIEECNNNYLQVAEAVLVNLLNDFSADDDKNKEVETLLLNREKGISWLKYELEIEQPNNKHTYQIDKLNLVLKSPDVLGECKVSLDKDINVFAKTLYSKCLKGKFENLIKQKKSMIVEIFKSIEKDNVSLDIDHKDVEIGFQAGRFYLKSASCKLPNNDCYRYLLPEVFLDKAALTSFLATNSLTKTEVIDKFRKQLEQRFAEQIESDKCGATDFCIKLGEHKLNVNIEQFEESPQNQLNGIMTWYLKHVSGFPESAIMCKGVICEINLSNKIAIVFDTQKDLHSPQTIFAKITPQLTKHLKNINTALNLPLSESSNIYCEPKSGCVVKLKHGAETITISPDSLMKDAKKLSLNYRKVAFQKNPLFNLGFDSEFFSVSCEKNDCYNGDVTLKLAQKDILLPASFFRKNLTLQAKYLEESFIAQLNNDLCKNKKENAEIIFGRSDVNLLSNYQIQLKSVCSKDNTLSKPQLHVVNQITSDKFKPVSLDGLFLVHKTIIAKVREQGWKQIKHYFEEGLNSGLSHIDSNKVEVKLPDVLDDNAQGKIKLTVNGKAIKPYSFIYDDSKEVQAQLKVYVKELAKHYYQNILEQEFKQQYEIVRAKLNNYVTLKKVKLKPLCEIDVSDVSSCIQMPKIASRAEIITEIKKQVLQSPDVLKLIEDTNHFVGFDLILIKSNGLYINEQPLKTIGGSAEQVIENWLKDMQVKVITHLTNKLNDAIGKEDTFGYSIQFKGSWISINKNNKLINKGKREISDLLTDPEREIKSILGLILQNEIDEKAEISAIRITEKVFKAIHLNMNFRKSADNTELIVSLADEWEYKKSYQNIKEMPKFIEEATTDYGIHKAQQKLNSSIEHSLSNICSTIDNTNLRGFPFPLNFECSEIGNIITSFEMIGKKFEVRSGIKFNPSDDKRSLKPNVNLQKLQLFPTVESVIAEQFKNALPDLKIIKIKYSESSIRLGISYYFSPLNTKVVSEIVIDKKNGLKVDFNIEEFIQQQVCNNIKNYISDNPQLISNIYQDLQLVSHPICTSGLLTVPISVAIGQIEVPGAVLVPMDGLPSLKLYLDDLLSFGNVLKELLGSINIGGTEFRTPYYSVEKGNVSLYLHSAIELDVIPGFGNISADYTISNKGLKLNGDIEVRSDMWFDIIPPYLSVGEFGIGLNPTEKSLSFLGAATISPGDAVSGIAKFNGKATLPLDPSNLYFKMEGELLMPGNTRLAHGNACLGKASDCKVTDIAPNKHLLDININTAIPGLKFISLDGFLRMQDDKEEFVKIGASGRLLGAELAKVLLTMSKELRGKLAAEIDLKIVNFEAKAKISPALVPSALSFNGELKDVVKFNGMADIEVGVSAALEPQGALKYVIPSFSVRVDSFAELFNLLNKLQLSLSLSLELPTEIGLGGKGFVGKKGKSGSDSRTSSGSTKVEKADIKSEHIKPEENNLGIVFNLVQQGKGCTRDYEEECVPLLGCDLKLIGGDAVPIRGWFTENDQQGVANYFSLPTGLASNNKLPPEKCYVSKKMNLPDFALARQGNKYNISRKPVSNSKALIELSDNNKINRITFSQAKKEFKKSDYNFAILDIIEKKYAILLAENNYHIVKNGDDMPLDGYKTNSKSIVAINTSPFNGAYKKNLSFHQKNLIRQLAETKMDGGKVYHLQDKKSKHLINESHALFKIEKHDNSKYYWVNYAKELPRSFEVISPTSSSTEMNDLFDTFNKLSEEYEIAEDCGDEQVSINQLPCGIVIFTNNTALILNTVSDNNHKPAWIVHKNKVISGSWRPSALLLEKLDTDNNYLLNQIRSDDAWQGYLEQAIHDKISSDFTLVIGRSECSLKLSISECKVSELHKQTRIGIKYDSGAETNLEVFHSQTHCLKAKKADLDTFWKQKNINLERTKSMNSKGTIDNVGNELMLEAIIDETWMKPSQNGLWQANPIGAFEQGELKNNERGCKL